MTNSTFDERMKRHRQMLKTAGFSRVSLYVSGEARAALAAQRERGESMSKAFNRLVSRACGVARDETPDEARDFERRVRHARNEILHSLRPGNKNGPYTVAIKVYRLNGTGIRVTRDSLEPFDKES
ncbi:hypothetical protein F6X40_19930 [Paraburkholderia sp. UCT31]|uniref:hypothetical protein n=1 Tax=Paraburkholderia sp. UCT31 TaxID=2615209 RepID=UPI0016560469|nr:hypothetical protein [Paraburkholderia sp. UCT31]MBC8739026.1 hypothetical protein [Paraburkholderia sp. UCT31]